MASEKNLECYHREAAGISGPRRCSFRNKEIDRRQYGDERDIALIVQCIQKLLPANANSSQPAPATEHQHSRNYVTQPASGLEEMSLGPGYQTAQGRQERYIHESEPDSLSMTDRELILLLLRELRQLRKELKGALPFHH